MKILVVSDTHGHDENLMRVLQREWPIDALIHCGDLEGSEDYIPEAVECPCFFVRGNNDFSAICQRKKYSVWKIIALW